VRSSTTTLISALRILARDIKSEDGVANAAIAEAADRLEELNREIHADTTRLEWILSDDGGFFVYWNYDIEEWTPELKATRDWIDAARKSDSASRKAKR
jgi:hypothetical protein